MKDSSKKSLIRALGGLVILSLIGVFWTGNSLKTYSQQWQRRGLPESPPESLYIPSPVEAFVIGQTPDLWGNRWTEQNPLQVSDVPAAFAAAKVFAEVDKFFINKDQWEVGRILSSLANSGHFDLLERAMELPKTAANPRPPLGWLTEDCDILYQEFYFRLYQLRPAQWERSLKELTRCDPTSPSRLWLLSRSLEVFKDPKGQEVLNEIRGLSTRIELRPYRRWFAEELTKVGILFSHSEQVKK